MAHRSYLPFPKTWKNAALYFLAGALLPVVVVFGGAPVQTVIGLAFLGLVFAFGEAVVEAFLWLVSDLPNRSGGQRDRHFRATLYLTISSCLAGVMTSTIMLLFLLN